MTNIKHPNVRLLLLLLMVVTLCGLFAAEPAFAQGGLKRVETFIENVKKILTSVSVAVVTIAIMWAGYKFLFRHAALFECGKILAGGLLIGGAGELASYLLPSS